MPAPKPYTDVLGAREDGRIMLGTAAAPVALANGLEGVLTNTTAVRREIANQGNDLRILAERQARMSGSVGVIEHQSKELVKVVSDNLAEVADSMVRHFQEGVDAAVKSAQAAQAAVEAHTVKATQWLDSTNRPPGWIPPSPGAQQPVQASPAMRDTDVTPGHARLPGGARRDIEGGRDLSQQGPPASPGQTGRFDADTGEPVMNSEMWGRGRKVGVSELRGYMRQSLASKVSNMGLPENERLTQDASGHYRTADGSRWANKGEVEDFLARDKKFAVMRNYGTSIFDAKSVPGGIANMLPGAIGKTLGWAGAAYTIGSQVTSRLGAEREKNNEFVASEGIGQGEAFQERMRGRAFSIEQRARMGWDGGLSGQQADQLFKGATDIGYRGDQRDSALAFGTENFRKYGMSIRDTLDLLATAAKAGDESLSTLSQSLDDVTKAAKEGGISAEEARQNFAAAYGAATQSFGGQGTASVAAGAVTAAQAGLGHRYSGITTPGAYSDQMIQQIATETGRSFNQIAESQGAHGGVEYARYLQAHQMNAGMQVLGTDAPKFQAAKAAVGRPAGEGGRYSEEQITEMGKSFSDMDDRTLASILQGPEFGMTGVTVANARGMLTNVLSGNNNIAAQAEKIAGEQRRHKVGGVSAKDRTTQLALGSTNAEIDASGRSKAAHAAGRAAGLNKSQAERWIGGDTGLGRALSTSKLWHLGGSGDVGRARSEYEEIVEKGGGGVDKGYRSPMLEKFLKDGATGSTRVKVKGKNGDRVMTLKDAMQYHADEMERGEVEIVDGKEGWKGKTIAEATGMAVDDSVKVTSDKSAKGDKAGHNASYWERRWGHKDDGKGGTVTISPSPELKKLLLFSTTGNINYGETTPPVSDPGPAGRPSGQ